MLMTFRALIAVAGALALTASACAKEAAPPPAAPNVVSFHAVDFAFHGPDTIPAGMTTFKLANGGQTYHHLFIARIDSGKTYAEVQAAMAKPGPPPAWLVNVGGPNAPEPNAESNATFEIAAGTYVAYCVVDVPDHVPHIAKGMAKQIIVTPSTDPVAPAPVADIDLELFDYNFVLSKPVTAGAHTFKVTTRAGGQPHEIEILKLAPGKTPDDLSKWMGGKMDSPPPATAVGGVLAPLPGGPPVYFTADFAAGATYVLICFVPDANDQKPHFMHGMIQNVTVQ
jgi:hypothetical protein